MSERRRPSRYEVSQLMTVLSRAKLLDISMENYQDDICMGYILFYTCRILTIFLRPSFESRDMRNGRLFTFSSISHVSRTNNLHIIHASLLILIWNNQVHQIDLNIKIDFSRSLPRDPDLRFRGNSCKRLDQRY